MKIWGSKWVTPIIVLILSGLLFVIIKYECRDTSTLDDVPATTAQTESHIITPRDVDSEAPRGTGPDASRQVDVSRQKSAVGVADSGLALPDQEEHAEPEGKEYVLTVASPERVFVNLNGGKSRLTTFGDEQSELVLDRIIRGRVLTKEGGGPVLGAVVLAGRYLDSNWGSMGANHGTTTGSGGKFELAVPADIDLLMIAMHRAIGWSPATEIHAGRHNLRVDLQIPEPGSLQGMVTRAERPEYAVLQLISERTRKFMLEVETNPEDGSYRFDVLPPGTYKLTAAQKQTMRGGLSARRSAIVIIASGQTSKQNFDLPVGLILAVNTILPEKQEPKWISYTLLEGELKIGSAAELKALFQTPAGKKAKRMLLGGINLKDMMQFQDLTPGAYTLCVELEIESKDIPTFTCGPVILQEKPSVQEYTVDLATH